MIVKDAIADITLQQVLTRPEEFDVIATLTPSARGELEITDVNNRYIEKGAMTYDILEGWWTDAGTFESLLRANQLVAKTGANKV